MTRVVRNAALFCVAGILVASAALAGHRLAVEVLDVGLDLIRGQKAGDQREIEDRLD